MIFRRHPSKRALREWLHGDIDADVDRHVSTCVRCSNELEALDAADADVSLRDALLTVLDPPEDLVPRVEAGVMARLESRKVLGYVADVFGAGWETSRMLLTDENGADER